MGCSVCITMFSLRKIGRGIVGLERFSWDDVDWGPLNSSMSLCDHHTAPNSLLSVTQTGKLREDTDTVHLGKGQ